MYNYREHIMEDYLTLEEDIITNPERALQFEWLETNGLGGYASSTIYNCNTRKYHGLLIVPIPEYGSRYVLLSKYFTKVVVKKISFELSTSKFPGVYYPNGHKYIRSFSYQNSYPQVLYQIGDARILKSIMMLQNSNAVIVRYDVLESEHPLSFQVNPLLAYREYHALQKNNLSIQVGVTTDKGGWSISPYIGMPPMFFKTNCNTKFHPAPEWFENFEHLKEKARGYDFIEDLFTPGVFETKVLAKQNLMILAGLEHPKASLEELWDGEVALRKKRHQTILNTVAVPLNNHSGYIILRNNAHKFLINKQRDNLPSIIAGFPWFGEWGRDTMISLPGLTLYNGLDELLIQILKTYLSHAQKGLIPNQLNVRGTSSYNSIDASLWFFWVLQQYIQKHSLVSKAGKLQSIELIKKEFGATMHNILNALLSNEVPHAQVVDNGFFSVGSAETQLTWMDANSNGKPVTPRHGLPIEINALWYNALKFYQEIFFQDNKHTSSFSDKVDSTIESLELHFEQYYLIQENEYKYLCDTIIEGTQIKEIRPNQLVAIALPYKLIKDSTAKNVLLTVTQQLFTPLGLRTLSPSDYKYQGIYHGVQTERDNQYHQGTVWPFLLGIYTDAFIRVNGNNASELNDYLQKLLRGVEDQIRIRGIGGLGEIHDGDIPHTSRGCPFQAWSVAELIRSIEKLQGQLS